MFKFIHAADIHLDSPLRGLERYEGAPVDEIRGATRRAFDNLIGLAIEEGVAFLLLAGDLYDGPWRDYNTGLYFAKRMGRLRDAGVRVFIVAGNHDAASQITRHLRLPENVKVLSTREPESILLEDIGVAVHGRGFPKPPVTEDLSAGYPKGELQLFNIGLLHTSLDGRPGHERYAPCTVDGLRSKVTNTGPSAMSTSGVRAERDFEAWSGREEAPRLAEQAQQALSSLRAPSSRSSPADRSRAWRPTSTSRTSRCSSAFARRGSACG
jgi:DNA repair exonuclease SbcCD nuclease subunit